jgi:hypothetical protein
MFGGLGPGEHLAPWLAAAAGWATFIIVVRYGIDRGWWLRPEELWPEEVDERSPYFKLLCLSPRFNPDAGGDAAKFRELVEAKDQALEELGT